MFRWIVRHISVLLIVLFNLNQDLSAQIDRGSDRNIPSSTMDTLKKYALTYPNETQFSVTLINNGMVNFVGVKKKGWSIIYD